MNKVEIFETVAAVIREILEQPHLEIGPGTTAQDVPGWDSFAMVKMIIAIEEIFEFEFDTDELDNVRNVGDFVSVIERMKV